MDEFGPAIPMEVEGSIFGDVGCYNRWNDPARYAAVQPQVYQAVYDEIRDELLNTTVAQAEQIDFDVEMDIDRNID